MIKQYFISNDGITDEQALFFLYNVIGKYEGDYND